MATATMTTELDEEIQSLIPDETDSTALVLQGVVALDKIADSAMYLRVSSAGTDAATNIKNLKAVFEPICAQRFARHKRATQLMAEKLQPFEAVRKKASMLIGAYDQEQERIRRAEEARLQREAEEQAERDRKEQLALAESEAARISQERAIEDALELEAAGDHKGAEAVLNHPEPVAVYVPPAYVPPVILQKSVPKVAGKSSVTTWAWRLKRSESALQCPSLSLPGHQEEECSICLADVPREYLVLNTKLIGQLVKATKEKTAIPGIEPYPETGARFRG